MTDDDVARPDLAAAKVQDLFALYRGVLAELRARGIVRTSNAPIGDYAEYLVALALGGELAPNSERSFDLVSPKYGKVQVKCRVDDAKLGRPKGRLSPFRTFDFDRAAVVLFHADYTVRRAVLVPRDHIEALGTHNVHVNGSLVAINDALLEHSGNEDITERLRDTASES